MYTPLKYLKIHKSKNFQEYTSTESIEYITLTCESLCKTTLVWMTFCPFLCWQCVTVSSGWWTVAPCCCLDIYIPSLHITLQLGPGVTQSNISWHSAKAADKLIFFLADSLKNYSQSIDPAQRIHTGVQQEQKQHAETNPFLLFVLWNF